MSKVLSKLLEQPQEIITKAINKLEEKNGWPSHDVRSTAENLQKVRLKIGQLGLDPDDTTGEELYHALMVKFENDSRRFDEHFGLHGQTYDQKIKKAIKLVSNNAELPDRWVLKNTIAKDLLRQHPPKKVMKQLHYRSVDSLVKREDLAEIYLAVECIESTPWNKAHFRLASNLPTTAFERRPLKLQSLAQHWGVSHTDQTYVSSSDYGVLGLVPSDEVSQMSLLALVALLLDEVGAKPSDAAKLSPTVAWWSETDDLIAGLGGKPVALNLKDISLNQARNDNQHCASAQSHFWHQLLSRYENQPLIDEDELPKLELPVLNIGPSLNQPALEYVEDI
jgi:hypothetical protein